MADTATDPKVLATAPKAWKGWRSLQAAFNVGLPASIHNANALHRATMRKLR